MSTPSLQIEYYKFMSHPHPDYALVAWCATGPLVDHNGAFVLSRGEIQLTFRILGANL